MQMIWSKRTLNDELFNATAAAAKATELVDLKCKAADAAADGFQVNWTACLTWHC